MLKSKSRNKGMCNGVMLENGLILSYDDPLDFEDAWPGIAMMMSVMAGESIDNPAYKGANTNKAKVPSL